MREFSPLTQDLCLSSRHYFDAEGHFAGGEPEIFPSRLHISELVTESIDPGSRNLAGVSQLVSQRLSFVLRRQRHTGYASGDTRCSLRRT